MTGILSRIRRTGLLVVIGLILIVYVALGILYSQQGPRQKRLTEQSNQLQIVLNRPLAAIDQLKTEYDGVNQALVPTPMLELLNLLVGAASESGIDTTQSAEKFNIPPAKQVPNPVKVGNSQYRVTTFENIKVQGNTDSVLKFISHLDSGSVLKSMVLTKVVIEETELVDEKGKGTGVFETRAFLNIDYYTGLK